MTAPDLVEVIAGVLTGHQPLFSADPGDSWSPPEESVTCTCGEDLGGWVASGSDWEWPNWDADIAAHQARVVVAALAGAGTVEWGVENGHDPIDHVTEAPDQLFASLRCESRQSRGVPARVVSRLTLPWTAVE